MDPLTLCVIVLCVLFAIAVVVGGHLLEKFWEWWDDSVWDKQEEGDRPEPDDFPDSK